MGDSRQSGIITAAQFTGRSLFIRVATLQRGNSTTLNLQVGPKKPDDSHVYEWRFGRPWMYPPVTPVWPLADVNPWDEASYSGPLPSAAEHDAKQPCRSCGAAHAAPANYCGQCGFPLDAVEAIAAALNARTGDPTAGSATAGAELAALVERYTKKSARYERGRAELLDFIEADFTESASAQFVRGEPASTTAGLTVAAAQDIRQSIAATGRLSAEQVQNAELLLRYAPLQFGYWGAFKALVKSVPVDAVPDAYADAVARISSKDWSRPAPPTTVVENADFLGEFFPAASPATVKYLARRARRDLAALAKRSPDTYARVATRLILSWDRNLSRNAFAPAYVMLGAQSPLDAHSEHVALDPDMSSRRDAHPEIWNDRPQLVQQIFDGVKNSVEVQTWSYQVLESLGQAPTITGDHVALAVQSTYPPLALAASGALSRRPGLWGSLTVAQWIAFFFKGDDANIDAILDAMTVGKFRPAAVEAARYFLDFSTGKSPRVHRISVMFLSATQKQAGRRSIADPQADVAAVIAILNRSATKDKKLWKPVVEGLGIVQLEQVRRAVLADAPKSVIKAINDLLLEKKAHAADPGEAINWIASSDPAESKWGWWLLQYAGGLTGLLERLPQWIAGRRPDAPTLERIVRDVLKRAAAEDVPKLSAIVAAGLRGRADAADLAELLANTRLGRAAIWQVISAEDGNEFASRLGDNPAAVRLTGDDVRVDQMASATPGQLAFVLGYIQGNPGRIAGDLPFGLAAATSSLPSLQSEAIKQLTDSGHMQQAWFALAESFIPNAVTAVSDYVAGLNGDPEFRDAVLSLLGSGNASSRYIGLQLLRQRLAQSDDRSLWTALAESDDASIAELLVSEANLAERVDDHVLAAFDRRVLLGPRRGRRIKEAVKGRLKAAHVDSGLAEPSRVSALLELARGRTLKDKEWALEKLTELALNGVVVEGLDVSLVTKGDGS